MTTIKAQVTVDIWDDPEFCESKSGRCPNLHEPLWGSCSKFDVMLGDKGFDYTKCPECKKVWQGANTERRNRKFEKLINERETSSEAEH